MFYIILTIVIIILITILRIKYCKCPKCGSNDIKVNGKHLLMNGSEYTEFKCQKCGHFF